MKKKDNQQLEQGIGKIATRIKYAVLLGVEKIIDDEVQRLFKELKKLKSPR